MKLSRIIRLLVLALVVALVVLPVTAYAAVQQPSSNVKQNKSRAASPQPGPSPSVNPAQNIAQQSAAGTIGITAPASGATWYIGYNQTISWNGIGPAGKPLDPVSITLWKGGQLAATITSSASGENFTYQVPQTLAAGTYELRVTSKNYSSLEARQPVNISILSIITFTAPKSSPTWMAGSQQAITWTYTGTPGPLKLAMDAYSGGYSTVIATDVAYAAGSKSFTVPAPEAGPRYRIVAYSMVDGRAIAFSDYFNVGVPDITVTAPKYDQTWQKGNSGVIAWTCEPQNGPAKVELLKASTNQTATTIVPSIPITQGSLSWTPDNNIPDGTYFIRITNLNLGGWGDSGRFTIQTAPQPSPTLTVSKPFSNTSSSDEIVPGKSYTIPYQSKLLPATTNYKIEIVGATDNQVLQVVATSFAIPPSITGLYQYWIAPFNTAAYGKSYKVRMTSLGTSPYAKVAESPAFIIKNPTTGATSSTPSTSTGTTNTGTTNTSTNNTGTTSNTGSPTSQMLTQDTSFKYNATQSATFKKGTTVKLGANGYVQEGYLAAGGTQSLEYRSGKKATFTATSFVVFNNGYIQKGYLAPGSSQALEYRSGKTADFRATSYVIFGNGYVQEGYLINAISLEYGPNRSTYFKESSYVIFSNGYVQQGFLLQNTSLEYSFGKSTVFWKNSRVQFRSNGYVKSGQLAYATTLQVAPGQYYTYPAGALAEFNESGYCISGHTTVIN